MSSTSPLYAKLEFEGAINLVEIVDPSVCTIKELRKLFKEKHGARAMRGVLTYTLPHDDDKILLRSDQDILLAAKLRSWADQPIKICSEEAEEQEEEQTGDDGLDAFEQSEKTLALYGLAVPAQEIRTMFSALDMGPRRLIRCNLAHPRSLKRSNDKKQEDKDEISEDDENWEEVSSLKISDKPEEEEEVIIIQEAVSMSEDNTDKAGVVTADVTTTDDAVVTALRLKGVTLEASTIHALLRLLHVQPKKFVKLGLIKDLKVAREAYKTGGKTAAHVMFKQSPKSGGVKGWGRGLAGGRGRCGKGGPGKGRGRGCKGKGKGGHHHRHGHHQDQQQQGHGHGHYHHGQQHWGEQWAANKNNAANASPWTQPPVVNLPWTPNHQQHAAPADSADY